MTPLNLLLTSVLICAIIINCRYLRYKTGNKDLRIIKKCELRAE